VVNGPSPGTQEEPSVIERGSPVFERGIGVCFIEKEFVTIHSNNKGALP